MQKNKQEIFLEIFMVVIILLLGIFLRFYEIQSRPGFEWDEPVYTTIAESIKEYGYPTFLPENKENPRPYLFHPPFDHYLKSYWFEIIGESGIGQARLLAGKQSVFLLILLYFLVRHLSGKNAALLALFFISGCGWIVYTNRLNLLENGMMPLGVAGLLLYALAEKKENMIFYILAGVVLAFAAVYKHTGVYFLLVPIITFLFKKENGKNHLLMFFISAIVVLLYVASMFYFFKEEIFIQSKVQLQRALGIISSPGLNYGLEEVLFAFADTYWVFFTTIICLIVGPLFLGVRLIQYVKKKQPDNKAIIFSWTFCAIALLALMALRSPQYWIIMLVPLYVFLATELSEKTFRKEIAILLIALVMGLNIATWNFLFFKDNGNALLETFSYVENSIPGDARVLTEECIGARLKQDYYNIHVHQSEDSLNYIKPTHVITYSSTTVKPPIGPDLEEMLHYSTLEAEFSGFKEEIKVYQISPLWAFWKSTLGNK